MNFERIEKFLNFENRKKLKIAQCIKEKKPTNQSFLSLLEFFKL